jgi:hypothetical protein
MAQEKQNIQIPDLKGKTIEEFLREIEANCMIDDHGDIVIGERKKKPGFNKGIYE